MEQAQIMRHQQIQDEMVEKLDRITQAIKRMAVQQAQQLRRHLDDKAED